MRRYKCLRAQAGSKADREDSAMKILAINLGSTSTKFGVFEEGREPLTATLRHSPQELSPLGGIMGQENYRKLLMEDWLEGQGHPLSSFSLISARGGLIRPVEGGIYRVEKEVADDAATCRFGTHASNLGLVIASRWQEEYGVPAVFVDAPVTDELSPLARVSGYKGISRSCAFHALNAKRVIRLYCGDEGLDPYRHNFIVAHLGGGFSVGAFENMRAIDVNNAVEGEGPFTPERTGSLSSLNVLRLCERLGGDTKRTYETLYRNGGLQSYFGTNDVSSLLVKYEQDPQVSLILDSMCYNVSKAIGAMAAVLRGRVERVLLTGGVCYSERLTEIITRQVDWIAPVSVFPGEDELAALYEGGRRYLRGEEAAKPYPALARTNAKC